MHASSACLICVDDLCFKLNSCSVDQAVMVWNGSTWALCAVLCWASGCCFGDVSCICWSSLSALLRCEKKIDFCLSPLASPVFVCKTFPQNLFMLMMVAIVRWCACQQPSWLVLDGF